MESQCCFHQIVTSYASDYDSDSDSVATETGLNGYNHRQPKLGVRVNVSINSSCTLPAPWLLWGICPPDQSQGWGISNFVQPRGLAFANPWATPDLLTRTWLPIQIYPNLVPRVFWLFGQRGNADKDSGKMEICITRKLGNLVLVHMLQFKTEVKMTVLKKA